jgi:hypothetical protein
LSDLSNFSFKIFLEIFRGRFRGVLFFKVVSNHYVCSGLRRHRVKVESWASRCLHSLVRYQNSNDRLRSKISTLEPIVNSHVPTTPTLY